MSALAWETAKMTKRSIRLSMCLAAVAIGCADGEPTSATRSGSRGVSQGGAQDIGELRAIVARGEVPRRDTLDPLGFFAEHAVDLPEPDCGQRVCLEAQLAVAPRFDGGNWTMGFVALQSDVDPALEARPPTHVALAIETTTRTSEVRTSLAAAVGELAGGLRAGDRISVIRVGASAEVSLRDADPGGPGLADAVHVIAVAPGDDAAATYDGLALAGRALDGWEGARRIVLLTSGRADSGVRDEARVTALGEALVRTGISISVVGTGDELVSRLPTALGDLGSGMSYFAESGEALVEIFRLEGRTSLIPLATDFELRVIPAPGYRIGRIYGARRALAGPLLATLSSPMLVLGQREGADDVSHGRRGGGGGIFVELMADPTSGVGAGQPAFAVEASFLDGVTGSRRSLRREIVNALAPGENPGEQWPSFSDEAHAKPFMMLNMYLALDAVLDFYEAGDCARAMGVADLMQLSIEVWQARFDDPDVDADHDLLLDLRENVRTQCESDAPVVPIEPAWSGGCFFT
jgi:Ca-activated chloride channel family protein